VGDAMPTQDYSRLDEFNEHGQYNLPMWFTFFVMSKSHPTAHVIGCKISVAYFCPKMYL